jgi:hypothetical protein
MEELTHIIINIIPKVRLMGVVEALELSSKDTLMSWEIRSEELDWQALEVWVG